MMMMILYLLFLLALLPWTYSQKLIFKDSEEIEKKTLLQTELGPISGLIVNRDGVNVTCYLGIPYSEESSDKIRFERATLVKPWKETFKAVKQPPICYQKELDNFNATEFEIVRRLMGNDPDVLEYYETQKSENCLFLSIFTQTNTSKDNLNKTVLVWIHGGGFISGTPSLPFYDYPNIVANDSNLIIVSISYRINVFGFLNSGTDDLTGNFGLYDQILALQWVQKYISHFGGNPNNVVLWGQSAGAISIGYQMMSPISGDALFKRAILESGNALLPLAFAKSSYRQEAFVKLINLLECPFGSCEDSTTNCTVWIKQNFDEILKCLKGKSTEEIFQYYKSVASKYPLAFLPNSQDLTLFNMSSFWSGARNHQFSFTGEILIGTNEAEGAQYLSFGPFAKFYHRDRVDQNFTKQKIVSTLEQFLPEKSSMKMMIEPTIDLLLEGVPDVDNSTQVWNRYVQLVGDGVFVCTDYYFIDSYLKINQTQPEVQLKPPKVLYYRFKPVVSDPFDCPKWSFGACHTDELGFVFGTPILFQDKYPKTEVDTSNKIRTTWIQFAHNGLEKLDQTKNDDIHFVWEPFLPDKQQYLEIDFEKTQMKQGFPGYKCDELFVTLYETMDSIDMNQMKMIQM